MTGDDGWVDGVQFVELLCGQVPLLVQVQRLVDPGLQVQAVLHPAPVPHLRIVTSQDH